MTTLAQTATAQVTTQQTKPTPFNTPVGKWPYIWLIMETAELLNNPLYLIMHEFERHASKYPSSNDERRKFIIQKWGEKGIIVWQ